MARIVHRMLLALTFDLLAPARLVRAQGAFAG